MTNKDLDKLKQNVPSAWIPSLNSFIEKGDNAEIWDKDNKRYLDYVGGYAVLNTGHLNPRVIKKVEEQLKNYSHSCFAYAPHENAIKLADQIRDKLKSKGIEIEDTKNGTIWRKD